MNADTTRAMGLAAAATICTGAGIYLQLPPDRGPGFTAEEFGIVTPLEAPPGTRGVAWGSDGRITWGTVGPDGGTPAWEGDAAWWGEMGDLRLLRDEIGGDIEQDGHTWKLYAVRAFDPLTGEFLADAVCLEWRDFVLAGGSDWDGPRWLLCRVQVPGTGRLVVDVNRDGVVDTRDQIAFLNAWAKETGK